AAQSAQDLSVDTILQMHKSGVGEQVLITMISNSHKEFKLTPDDVIRLTNERVPQGVIQAMLNTVNVPASSTAAEPKYLDSNNPADLHSPGIWVLLAASQGRPKMAKLQPARAIAQE